MVIESLVNPFSLRKKPWEMFVAGFFYSIIALFVSYLVFKEVAGILMVFLIIMSALPLIYTLIKNEEEIDLKYKKEWSILKEHSHVIIFLVFLFLGITAGMIACYVFLPNSIVQSVFALQGKAIYAVNSSILGGITAFGLFKKILFNNVKVLFFCLAFAFIYGAGAIFILTWNASVIAVAIGNLIKTELAKTASLVGFSSIASYFSITAFSVMRYMTHGIFEIAAYFVAGLAGSIISVAIIKKDLDNEQVIYDTTELILLSFAMLIIAAIIEVFVTPKIF